MFKAIALATPGGLGESSDQDVSGQATVNLVEAMRLASDRDRIALQYCTGFKDIFDFCVLRYNNAHNRWGNQNWAALQVFSSLLSRFPDSHIERKYGNQFTDRVSARMAELDRELSKTDNPETLISLLYEVDKEFKDGGINPGTTADMTVATVLAVLLGTLFSSDY